MPLVKKITPTGLHVTITCNFCSKVLNEIEVIGDVSMFDDIKLPSYFICQPCHIANYRKRDLN